MKSLKQIREASGGKEAYMKFFNSLLKKHGVSSPSELKGDKKKAFFNALDKGWESDDPNDKNEKYEDPDNLDPDTTVDSDEDLADKAASQVTEKMVVTKIDKDTNSPAYKKFKAGDKRYVYKEIYDDPDNLDPDTTLNPDEDDLDEGKNYPVMDQGQRAKIIKIAKANSGNMAKAIKLIDRIRKGLSDNPDVMDLLKKANEDVNEAMSKGELKHDKEFMHKKLKGNNNKSMKITTAKALDGVSINGRHVEWSGKVGKLLTKHKVTIRNDRDGDVSVWGKGDDVNNFLKAVGHKAESYEVGTDKYKKHAKKCVPGQNDSVNEANRFSKKLNRPAKHIYDLVLKDIRRNRTTDKKEVDAVVDDIAGVSLTDKEVALVKLAIQHESVNEATKLKAGRGKITVDLNWDGSAKDKKFAETKYKIKLKITRTGALVTGEKARVLAYVSGQDYAMDDEDIEDLMPEILQNYHEAVAVDRRTVGFKAAMIRNEKAKKVREKAKLKKEKKKEQEVLDARYDYDGGVDTVLAAANKAIFGETAANSVASGNVDMAPNAGKKKKKSLTVIRRNTY